MKGKLGLKLSVIGNATQCVEKYGESFDEDQAGQVTEGAYAGGSLR